MKAALRGKEGGFREGIVKVTFEGGGGGEFV